MQDCVGDKSLPCGHIVFICSTHVGLDCSVAESTKVHAHDIKVTIGEIALIRYFGGKSIILCVNVLH